MRMLKTDYHISIMKKLNISLDQYEGVKKWTDILSK